MAAYRLYDTSPHLEVFTAERTWDSYDFLGFLGALPKARVPRVVVLDNASLHTSHVVRRRSPGRCTNSSNVILVVVVAIAILRGICT
jgi:putative transposase